MPTATDTPTHTAAVKGRISTATRSQVRNPVTAMASTFEKASPGLQNHQKPSCDRHCHHSHKQRKQPPGPECPYISSQEIRRKYCQEHCCSQLGNNSLIFFHPSVPPVSDSAPQTDKVRKCLSSDLYDPFHVDRIFPACLGRNVMGIYST